MACLVDMLALYRVYVYLPNSVLVEYALVGLLLLLLLKIGLLVWEAIPLN